jgi:hypothetical protein
LKVNYIWIGEGGIVVDPQDTLRHSRFP